MLDPDRCEDSQLYLDHHKEALRPANKEASVSQENEVIIAVRQCPEVGKKMEKWKGGSKKMEKGESVLI